MGRRLKDKLPLSFPSEELKHTYNSFDIIGDIAIVKVANDNIANAEAVAKQIMAVHRSVRTVFWQTSPILGDFRVRDLKLVAGEVRTTTRHKESGCVFAVDVEKCYFSRPGFRRTGTIAGLVKNGETVVNMFAAVTAALA